MDGGRGRHDCGIQSRCGAGSVGRDAGSRRDDGTGIESEAGAGLVAGDVERSGRNYVGGKAGCDEGRMQAFGGRRSGVGLEGEQVGDGDGGSGKLKVGGVDDLRGERCAARDVNGLGTVMGFVASGACGGAGLGSAEIFDAGEFVAGIVDDFIGLQTGRGVGAQSVDFAGNDDDREEQKGFEKPGGEESTIREKTVGSFAGEAGAGAGKGGADGSDKLVPTRRPLDQELGSVVEVGGGFELESVGHGVIECVSGDEPQGLKPRLKASNLSQR